MDKSEKDEKLSEARAIEVIELEDEGEVLLFKIHKLKQDIREFDQRKQDELRDYEKQLRLLPSTTEPKAESNTGKSAETKDGATNTISGDVDPVSGVKDESMSNNLDAYELLKEKHRISSGVIASSKPTTTTSISETEDINPIDDGNLARKKATAVRHSENESQFASTKHDVKELGSGEFAKHGVTAAGVVPAMRRGNRLRDESLPGAVSINGVSSTTMTRDRTNRVEQTIDEENATQDEVRANTGDTLIEANLVTETAGSNPGPLIVAKRDPWYRRNQWWLAGALVLVVASIILSIVLTTIDLNPNPAPTLSPTSTAEGIGANVEAVVLSYFPTAAVNLADDASSQSEALRWVSEQRLNHPSKSTSNSTTLQQYALVTLYMSTLGKSSWNRTDGWLLDGTDECTWYGVECEVVAEDSDKLVVVGLSLSSNNVSGSIPSDLSILSSYLLKLDLSMNYLTGSIPSEIGLLSSLTNLNLTSNTLVRAIPMSLTRLLKLENLDLSSNILTGLIPSQIGNLATLRSMDMSHNDLIEGIPSEIGRLARLEYLSCEGNRLSFDLPTELGLLTRLEVLHGGSNDFVGMLPPEIRSLRSLVSVDLSDNLISGSIPYQIVLLSNLTSLDLSSNMFGGEVPTDIGLLRRLKSLHLNDNNLHHLLPESIGFLTELMHLDVSGNLVQIPAPNICISHGKMDGDVPWLQLSQLTNLITLDLSGMPAGLSTTEDKLLQLTQLELLGVAQSDLERPRCGVEDALPFLVALTTLRELDLSNNSLQRNLNAFELNLLTRLEILDLRGNSFTGAFPAELASLKHLKVLNLKGSPISGTIPAEIFELTNLINLNLSGDAVYSKNNLTGSLPSSIGQATQLQRLDISFSYITGSIPSEITELTKLEELQFRSATINGTIPTEIQKLRRLRIFDMHATLVSGPMPDFNFQLGRMEKLDLSSTRLSGSIPSGLWPMPLLTFFDITDIPNIFGILPSEIGFLTSLTVLNIVGVNFTGSMLPSEIGLLTQLQALNLSGNSFSGAIPSSLFHYTQLTSLQMNSNYFTGSLPSEIGLATNLRDLQIPGSLITGSIPTDIGSLLLLQKLDLSNTNISGKIVSELSGQLVLLQDLNLGSTHISGPFPTEISKLLSLQKLSLAHTDVTGTITSEVGRLAELRKLDMSYSSIGGSVPIEMENLVYLESMDLRGTAMTGSIPHHTCGFGDYFVDGSQVNFIRKVYIDCDAEVECDCCTCFLTIPPSRSLSPSVSSSTLQPSQSSAPTTAPSHSAVPSITSSPTANRICLPFSSIAEIGTAIFYPWTTDEGFVNITLPFPIMWRGQKEYSTVTVTPNGVIILGDYGSCTIAPCDLSIDQNAYRDCCEAFPVGEFADFGHPRIVLGQADLQFSSNSQSVQSDGYYATVDDAFVISYEGASFFSASSNPDKLYFQVALYPDGTIEMRWGQGFPKEGISVAVGLEDADIAIPATGQPFDNRGVTTMGTWPANQCRTFYPTKYGNYTEYSPPADSPSATSANPSASIVPTVDSACEPFLPINATGSPIFSFSNSNESLVTVLLPFLFQWRGEETGEEYSSVTVSPNGVLFLGDAADCPIWCQYDLVSCCDAFPIGELSASRIPRIALAQQQNLQGPAYSAIVGEAFIISFEGVDFYRQTNVNESNLFFQAAFYADGRVEMRWGKGVPRYYETVAAGLEDFAMAVPATGVPFEDNGVTRSFGGWPTDQCRMFVPNANGKYTELF